MYRLADVIDNDGPASMVPEISFHPSGSCFAASYANAGEVRIYETATRRLMKVFKNPESQLGHPHGVLFTESYLLVSYIHSFRQTRPGGINVYRNDSASTEPIQIFMTPFAHLREPHSLAMRDGKLVATYCENSAPSGAVVSYAFDEGTGTILGPMDKTEACFFEFGDSKGVSFSGDGTKLFVTFESDPPEPLPNRISTALRVERIRSVLSNPGATVADKLRDLGALLRKKLVQTKLQLNGESRSEPDKPEPERPEPPAKRPTKNGIAMFGISPDGKIDRNPERLLVRKEFCRLENIHVLDRTCAVTNLSDNSVAIYDLNQDPGLRHPVQKMNLGKATPHGAKFSPDGKLLVVSSLGVKVINKEPKFFAWESPREDKIFVFERTT
jgi:DNA-binding beta-propeller fold protein YncE